MMREIDRGIRIFRSLFAPAILALVWAPPTAAHEEGVLTVGRSAVAAGETVRVTGEKFSAATSFELVLKGAISEYGVGSIESDGQGAFSIELAIPADVRTGAYRLVAVAPDGDDAAAVDLQVDAAPAPVEAGADDSAGVGSDEVSGMPMPRAEEMTITRSYSGVEWFLVGLATGGALVAGVWLYRRPKASASA